MQREEQANSLLAAMEERLKKGPADVLGLTISSPPEAARRAFLELTKIYHPNRFARFSPQTQRRANLVFVSIKRAHDEFIKSGRGSGNLRPGDEAMAYERPSLAQIARPSATRVGDAPTPQPVASRGPVTNTVQPPTVAAAVRSRRPSAIPQWLPQGASRPKSTSSPPSLGAAPKPSPTPGESASRSIATTKPASSGPAPSNAAHRPMGAGTPQPKPPIRSPEELKFDEAKLAVNQQRWGDADVLLGELAVAQPMEKKFRVFRHYVRGRQAQDENRIADARQEYERALALDATFASARIALGQLPAGGLLGRLFKR